MTANPSVKAGHSPSTHLMGAIILNQPISWGLFKHTIAPPDLSGLRHYLHVIERVAATDFGLAAVSVAHHAATLSLARASPRLRECYQEPLLSYKRTMSLAITEPAAGSNPRAMVAEGKHSEACWSLSGEKSCITGATATGLAVTLFRASNVPHELTAAVVALNSRGLTLSEPHPTLGLQSLPVRDLHFNSVPVEPWQIVGQVGQGLEVLSDVFLFSRFCVGAMALGVMRRCFQLIYRYASRRTVAGGPLIDNPVVSRTLQRIAAEISLLNAFTQTTAPVLVDTSQADLAADLAIVTKVAGSEFAWKAVDDTVQLLGWRGYCENNIAAQLLRDVRFLRIGEGPTEVLATQLGGALVSGQSRVMAWLKAGHSTSPAADWLQTAAATFARQDNYGFLHDFGWLAIWSCLRGCTKLDSIAAHRAERGWKHALDVARDNLDELLDGKDGNLNHWLPVYSNAIGSLDCMTAEGSQLDPLLQARRSIGIDERLLGPIKPAPEQTVDAMIWAQIRRTPDSIACRDQWEELNYRELGRRAMRLSGVLALHGIKPCDTVAVLTGRSVDAVVAALAVLSAGASLVVLNQNNPASRLTGMLVDIRCTTLIVDSQTRQILSDELFQHIELSSLPESVPFVEPTGHVDAPAYINFTSGSTGRPKAVAVPHSALANQIRWRQEEFEIKASDCVLQSASPGFDIYIWEMFGPLAAGACLVFPTSSSASWDPGVLINSIEHHGATIIQIVPSQLEVLLEHSEIERCKSIRLVICGGEPLPVALSHRAMSILRAELVNLYGPAEAGIDATFHRCGVEDGNSGWIPIGKPIANARLYVVDPEGQLVAHGEPGELWIGGTGVGLGYVADEDLTQKLFLSDPWASTSKARVYRSGDRVRVRSDGILEFAGRLDRQLKLHGVRIDPAEIEQSLCAFPGVEQAVANVQERKGGQPVLVAYILAKGACGTLTQDALREYAQSHLSPSMIPSIFAIVDHLPRTLTGKVDHRSLPPIEWDTIKESKEPFDVRIQALASIWEEVLGVPIGSAETDFLSMGGSSLAAIRVAVRVREQFKVDVSPKDVLDTLTLARLSARIDEKTTARPDNAHIVVGLQPSPTTRAGSIPLTPTQAALWFHQRLIPDSGVYNVVEAVRIGGLIAVSTLQAAFTEVVIRHETLRTIYPEMRGLPTQEILTPDPVRIECADLHADFLAGGEQAVLDHLSLFARKPFDLTRDRPLRVLLCSVSPTKHWLLWVVHHIAADGWSAASILPSELTRACIDAGPTHLESSLPLQFVDYWRWYDKATPAHLRQQRANFWRERLLGAPAESTVPPDFARPAIGMGRGKRVDLKFGSGDRLRMRELAHEMKVTPYVILASAFAAWLRRASEQDEVVIGTALFGRHHPSAEKMIGNFANMVPLRCSVDPDSSYTSLIQNLSSEIKFAIANEIPFSEIVDAVSPSRFGTRNPLFQTAISLYDGTISPLQFPGAIVESASVDPQTSKFDVLAFLVDDGAQMHGYLEFDAELFAESTMYRMARQFVDKFRQVIDHTTRGANQ
ncbi:amino acid adenylation domain-containing protein [Caballeronia sp. EK]|uniref:non-ribosomal peptide synthetase n=1 Tax=Caballeronia sp. EK TaxID=2767469 RepID=UPI001654C660|nr:non-ribosomal peptide synthetase [Caballeronia sp. EK]MBC8643004.1 amino acid adenylation domain-containing protein [Caballeronia sp. EK]